MKKAIQIGKSYNIRQLTANTCSQNVTVTSYIKLPGRAPRVAYIDGRGRTRYMAASAFASRIRD